MKKLILIAVFCTGCASTAPTAPITSFPIENAKGELIAYIECPITDLSMSAEDYIAKGECNFNILRRGR